jgi:hypothetical protein
MGVRTVRPSMALSISIIYILLKHGGPPADGGHPGGRRAGGHPGGRPAGGRWAYMLTLRGTGGYGGSPNAEAGNREDVSTPDPGGGFSFRSRSETAVTARSRLGNETVTGL